MGTDNFHRIAAIHAGCTVIAVVLACVLNVCLWSYAPDTRFETLETMLLPVFKLFFALVTIGAVLGIVFDRLTLRVLRKHSLN